MLAAPRPGMNTDALEDGEQDVLSLKDLIRVIRRRAWVVALAALVLTALALGYSLMQPPQYETSARVLLVVQKVIGQAEDAPERPDQVEQAPDSLQGDAQTIELYAATMAQALPNTRVAEKVVQQLDLEASPSDLLEHMTVESVPETSLVEITVTDSDPETARSVANAVAEAATEESVPVDQMEKNNVTAVTWEEAQTPETPVTPQPLRNALIGLVMGTILGVGLAFLLEYLDDGLRSPDEAERVSGLPAMGVIPDYEIPYVRERRAWQGWFRTGDRHDEGPGAAADNPLVTTADPGAPAAEAYRALRTMLLHAFVDRAPKTIVFTGIGGNGHQTATCANLGVVLSQVDKKVLILDCDFRNPTTGRLFGLHNADGLADVLEGRCDLREVWSEPLPGLRVVAAGSVPHDPTELLGSERFSRFLDGLRGKFDYVLIDTPPIGVAPDAAILSSRSDGVLLVLQTHTTLKESVQPAVYSLKAFGANVLGMVIDNTRGLDGYSNNGRSTRSIRQGVSVADGAQGS
jgi:succinoglycan biosynthesis transport protein ExoP